jgi:hypothetical protein
MGTVTDAIAEAESTLSSVPGPAADGHEDPRWQAVIAVAKFIEAHPLEVWGFVSRWGCSRDEDLRIAIATCALEHLLEHHFELIFPEVQALAGESAHFADTVRTCWAFDREMPSMNAAKLRALQERLRHVV